MNVKKESLRIKILDYLSSHPRSEVKDIASYVQITKQALYYHIKLLSRQEKIKIVDTQIINGFEKKFYAVEPPVHAYYDAFEQKLFISKCTVKCYSSTPSGRPDLSNNLVPQSRGLI